MLTVKQEEELLDRCRVACACLLHRHKDRSEVEEPANTLSLPTASNALRHVKSTASSSRARAVKYVVRLKSSQPTHWRGRE